MYQTTGDAIFSGPEDPGPETQGPETLNSHMYVNMYVTYVVLVSL